jgi:hypothetical protein
MEEWTMAEAPFMYWVGMHTAPGLAEAEVAAYGDF